MRLQLVVKSTEVIMTTENLRNIMYRAAELEDEKVSAVCWRGLR